MAFSWVARLPAVLTGAKALAETAKATEQAAASFILVFAYLFDKRGDCALLRVTASTGQNQD